MKIISLLFPLLSIFFSFGITSFLFPRTGQPDSAYDVYLLNRQADEAFASGDYQKALEYYSQVDRYAELFPDSKQYLNQALYGINQTGLAAKHRELLPLKPRIVHSMVIVYIKNTRVFLEDKKGGRFVETVITEKEIQKSEIAQEIFKKYIEVLTRGEVSIRFTRTVLESTLTNLIINTSKDYQNRPLETRKADFHSLVPFDRNLLMPLFESHDSVLFYWNDQGISGRPTGELVHVPVVPYQLIGNKRGFLQMPIVYTNAGTLLHEFFHCLEDMYGIYPRHGFLGEVRKKYPLWTGEGQYDYYRFHFDGIIKKKGWERFLFSKYYGFKMDEKTIIKNEQLAKKISDKKKREAFKNFLDADRIFTSDTKKAVGLLKKALKKNPYLAPALTLLAQYASSKKENETYYKQIDKSFEINPFHYRTLYLLGVAWRKRGDNKKALLFLSSAIETAPLYSKSYFYRGFVYYLLKDGPKALADYRTYIGLEPGKKESILNFYRSPAEKGNTVAREILNGLL